MTAAVQGVTHLHVVEVGSRNSLPIVLPVLSERPGYFLTPELFSVGLRDLAPSYIRRKVVRWNKETGRRMGESAEPGLTSFRVAGRLAGDIPADLFRSAIVVKS